MQVNKCTPSNYAIIRLMSFQLTLQQLGLIWAISLMAILTGCSQMPVEQGQDAVKNDTPTIPPAAVTTEVPDAIKSLLKQSETQRLKQDYNGALATLERALRINPRNADVWSHMAQVYLEQGDLEQAKQHAKRSNSVIKNNARLKAFNNQIIEKSSSIHLQAIKKTT